MIGEFKSRRGLVVLLAVAVATLVGLLLLAGHFLGGSEAQKKFASYFDRQGVFRLTYFTGAKQKGARNIEWVEPTTQKDKQVATYKGRMLKFLLTDAHKSQELIPDDNRLFTERMSRLKQPILLRAIDEAKKGNLERTGRDGDTVYFSFKFDKKHPGREPEWLPAAEIGIDKTSGKLKQVRYQVESGKQQLDVRSISRLPASSSKSIFTTAELKTSGNKPDTKLSGFDAKTLRSFKSFTPYWLGKEVDRHKVSAISGRDKPFKKGDKMPTGYRVTYGPEGSPEIDFLALSNADDEAHDYIYARPLLLKTTTHGFPTRLVKFYAVPRIYIRTAESILRIDGYSYPHQPKKFLKIVRQNLQEP